jgi:hypothetical protein
MNHRLAQLHRAVPLFLEERMYGWSHVLSLSKNIIYSPLALDVLEQRPGEVIIRVYLTLAQRSNPIARPAGLVARPLLTPSFALPCKTPGTTSSLSRGGRSVEGTLTYIPIAVVGHEYVDLDRITTDINITKQRRQSNPPLIPVTFRGLRTEELSPSDKFNGTG